MALKNIVITGFMGTGKTTVCMELSRLTGYRCVEVDAEIEKSAGMSIPEIFEKLGETAFRDLETGEIKRISEGRGLVISTGGGAVLRKENMEALRRGGTIICLNASPGTILERTSKNSYRPLLQVEDPLGKIKEMLAYRKPYYDKADAQVDTEGKNPLELANEILDIVGWKGKGR